MDSDTKDMPSTASSITNIYLHIEKISAVSTMAITPRYQHIHLL